MKITNGESSVLRESDAEKQVEGRITALHHPTATLLKWAITAAPPRLLPTFSIRRSTPTCHFCRIRKFVGLAADGTLRRLADSGTRVYRTAIDGAVTFYLDGNWVTPSVTGLR